MGLDDTLIKALKDNGFVTKDDIPKTELKQDPNMINVNEVIDHMNSCTSDDCGIHKAMNSREGIAMKKGFVLGYGYGKKK